MTSEEYIAENKTVNVKAAIAEVRRHGMEARIEGDELLLNEPGFEPDRLAIVDGRVSTAQVFAWLGY